MTTGIWEQDSTEFKLQPLTDELQNNAEDTFGVKLPDSYLTILYEQNGGRISYNAYPSSAPTAWGDAFITVDHIKGIGSGDGILENAYLIKEWGMPEGLILFSGDGHTWLAFDYRKTDANPPIIYVDNESEQMMQIAGSFEEFLTHLYIENPADFEEDEYDTKEYSEHDLEMYKQQNNVEELQLALMQLSQTDVDVKWFSKQLLQLSSHPSANIRTNVAQIVWDISYQIDDTTLLLLIKNFESDTEIDVQQYADMIEEKMDYPFEQLQQDVELEGMASFFYQDEIYHVNEHSELWHLSDYQTDFYSFHSVEELLQQATINGKTLKEIWSQVKKV